MKEQFLLKAPFSGLLFIVLIVFSFSTYTFAQSAGTLDNTFGTDGIVITSIDTINDKGNSLAIQSDGKIILGGSTQDSYPASDFALVRYNNDGSLDTTFGNGGKVITTIENRSEGQSLAIQTDGKIILGGYSDWYINLARYNTDGSLDTTFGTGGIVITDVFGFYSDRCKSVAIQSDGKIVVGGYANHNNYDLRHFVVIRYNNDGSLDTSFGINGIVIGGLGNCESLRIQNDGKILLGGSTDFSFALERYNSDGSLDNTFGIGGKVTTTFQNNCLGNSMELQSDGKIVIGGSCGLPSGDFTFTLARYLSDGSLDDSFGTNGIVSTPTGISSRGNSVVIQNDGKILLAGDSKDSSNPFNFALARYNSDGTFDTGFGSGGLIVTPVGISSSVGQSLGIENNGKIILGGYVYNDSNLEMALVRYNNSTIAGIKEGMFRELDPKIYPNPSSGDFSVKFGTFQNSVRINVLSLSGEHLHTFKKENCDLIELELDQPSGLYIIEIIQDKQRSFQRLIKY
jgi:uncharacterized delta-60 repeat protein